MKHCIGLLEFEWSTKGRSRTLDKKLINLRSDSFETDQLYKAKNNYKETILSINVLKNLPLHQFCGFYLPDILQTCQFHWAESQICIGEICACYTAQLNMQKWHYSHRLIGHQSLALELGVDLFRRYSTWLESLKKTEGEICEWNRISYKKIPWIFV